MPTATQLESLFRLIGDVQLSWFKVQSFKGELTKLTLELTRLTLELTKLTLELTRLTLELTKLSVELTKLSVELTRLSIEDESLSLKPKDSGVKVAHRLLIKFMGNLDPKRSLRKNCES